MAKNKTQVKKQKASNNQPKLELTYLETERKKRQAHLVQIEQGINKRQQEIAALVEMKFRTLGALEQLEELSKE